MVIDWTATVTCHLHGILLAKRARKFAGTLDNAGARPATDAEVIEEVRLDLIRDRMIDPADQHDPGLRFYVAWSSSQASS
jgi:hypothetical protein